MKPQKNLRILITSDVHCTDLEEWYGLSLRERMRHWADAVQAEHAAHPFDLMVIAGDVSLDYWIYRGSVHRSGVGTTGLFVREILPLLPAGLPRFLLPGNHEQYADGDWFRLTGNHRQDSLALNGCLFLFLDNYAGRLDPADDHDGVYTGADMTFIRGQMEKYPDCDVYPIAHHFDPALESEGFRRLVAENSRVRGLFSGHTHRAETIPLGADWGNKTLSQTGNFSYFVGTPENDFWGFRELEISGEKAVSRYIIPPIAATVDGQPFHTNRAVRHETVL